MAGQVKLKEKKNSAKTKSGIIGPRLHFNSVFQLVLTVNPRSERENRRHEASCRQVHT